MKATLTGGGVGSEGGVGGGRAQVARTIALRSIITPAGKIWASGKKRTRVPRRGAAPASSSCFEVASGASGTPLWNRWTCSIPSRHTVTCGRSAVHRDGVVMGARW